MLDYAEREAIYQIAIVQARTQRTPAERRRWQYADWTGLDRRVGDGGVTADKGAYPDMRRAIRSLAEDLGLKT